MPEIPPEVTAPPFTAEDYRGQTVSLSDYEGSKVVLVFNRGFV